MTTAIPAWRNLEVIPPIRSGSSVGNLGKSTYIADLAVQFDRFGISRERMALLDGLLRFRAALYDAGITSGFQRQDGSFLVQVKLVEGRLPRDIDVAKSSRWSSDEICTN